MTLERIVIASGADTSGGIFPTWPEPLEYAAQQVERLRDDYEEALEELASLTARLAEAERRIEVAIDLNVRVQAALAEAT